MFFLSITSLIIVIKFKIVMNGLSFFIATPKSLIRTVYLNNTMHFGLRGRHEHEQMLWGDVELKTDATWEKYIEFTERASKTRSGISSDCRLFLPKMFAKKGICFRFINQIKYFF